MSSALLSLSRSVQELTEENQSLKEDLDRMLSNSPTASRMQGTSQGPAQGGGARGGPALAAEARDVRQVADSEGGH